MQLSWNIFLSFCEWTVYCNDTAFLLNEIPYLLNGVVIESVTIHQLSHQRWPFSSYQLTCVCSFLPFLNPPGVENPKLQTLHTSLANTYMRMYKASILRFWTFFCTRLSLVTIFNCGIMTSSYQNLNFASFASGCFLMTLHLTC